MRYLALDLGGKRTGLAVGDDDTFIISPIGRVEHANETHFIEQLPKVIREHEPDAIVVGLPLNMDGTEGPQAKKVIALAKLIEQQTKLAVHLFDERLTSFEADGMMGPMELTRAGKKLRRDALAAVTILCDFMSHAERTKNQSECEQGDQEKYGEQKYQDEHECDDGE